MLHRVEMPMSPETAVHDWSPSLSIGFCQVRCLVKSTFSCIVRLAFVCVFVDGLLAEFTWILWPLRYSSKLNLEVNNKALNFVIPFESIKSERILYHSSCCVVNLNKLGRLTGAYVFPKPKNRNFRDNVPFN